MRKSANGLSLSRLRAVNVLAGTESEGTDDAGCESEAVAEWLRDDPEFIAGLNRAKLFRRERLRADVLSLASDAMATLRELVSGPDVPPSVRLRASLAILDAADALKGEEIGPTSADAVQAKIEHKRFIDSLADRSNRMAFWYDLIRRSESLPERSRPRGMTKMSDRPGPRRWLRFTHFSVRGLIVVALVVGAGLGWIVRSAHIQREAVAAITTAGGSVRYNWEWNDGNVGKPWAPRWLVDLIGVDFFGHVTAVWLARSESDEVIAQVRLLTRLQQLGIWSLGDAELANLQGLTELNCLSLYGPRVTDAGLAHLKSLPNLRFLNLIHTNVTDAGLAHLKGLTNLSELYISGHTVTLAGAKELNQALPSLKISH